LNASPSLPGGATVTVEAYNGTTAGTLQHDNLAAFTLLNTFETNYGGQTLELAVLVSGVTPAGTETFGLNFASESVDGITAVDVTDIAVVPEPTSMSLLLLGGLPLVSRRRRRHS